MQKWIYKRTPKYKCKNCGYQFVLTLQKGFDEQTKLILCLLYIRTIAHLLNASITSILNWIKKFSLQHYEKLQPASEALVIQFK